MTSVAIVGGGFCGSLVALHLLKENRGPLDVHLIERGAVGRGAAYGTAEPGHLLNVPAENMSAFPDDPGHFRRWLHDRDSGVFAPRTFYGLYIESILKEAAAAAAPGVAFHLVREEAVGVESGAGASTVVLGSGRKIAAARVVLALGNIPSRSLEEGAGLSRLGERYIADPWDTKALGRVAPEDAVLLAGTGLTMADIVVSLVKSGHRGRVHAFSRHGLLPQSHGDSKPVGSFPEAGASGRTVRSVLRWLRDHSERSGWRGAMDALRPRVQELWRSLDEAERRRFLRHARPYWDSHRHRLPPQVHGLLSSLIESGRLSVLAGRLESVEPGAAGALARLRPRAGSGTRTLDVQWVLNCTGPECDPSKIREPLIAGLLARGLARPDPLGLGLDADEQGALLSAGEGASKTLFTLGAWRKGRLWESVAVPELRVQARALAIRLLNDRN